MTVGNIIRTVSVHRNPSFAVGKKYTSTTNRFKYFICDEKQIHTGLDDRCNIPARSTTVEDCTNVEYDA